VASILLLFFSSFNPSNLSTLSWYRSTLSYLGPSYLPRRLHRSSTSSPAALQSQGKFPYTICHFALPALPFNSTPAICNETSQASVCGGSLQQQAPASLFFPFQPQPNHHPKILRGEHCGESSTKNPVGPQTIPESPQTQWFGEPLPFAFPSTNPGGEFSS
jgi:hypothetical protein